MATFVDLPSGQTALKIDFKPSAKSHAFITDPAYITGFFGPFGCGKTSAGVIKTWLYGQAFPGAKIAALRDTWPNLRDTTRATFFEWLPPGIAGHYHKTDKMFEVYTSQGPFFVYFRHLDSEADITNVLSLELAAAWFDEPQGGVNSRGGVDPGINVKLYQSMLGRIGRQKGYRLPLLWMTGNAPDIAHWIAQEFDYHGEAEPVNPDPDRHLYLGHPEDNVENLEEGWGYYERLERNYGRETPMARRFARGEWISMGMEKPFHPAWIQRWGPGQEIAALPPHYQDDRSGHPGLIVEVGFDPAISEKDTAARSALVVAGQVRHPLMRGRLLILEAIAGHWSVWEQVRQILNAVVRWKARTVRVEDVAYQKALRDILDREAHTRGIHVHIELVKPDGDKLRRANAWSPLVEDGTVLFPTTAAEDLIACMLAVPGDRSKWDPVDAAGLCLRGFPALEAARTRLPGPTVSTPERAQSYALRGGGMPLSAVVTWEKFGARTPDLRGRARGYAQRRPS